MTSQDVKNCNIVEGSNMVELIASVSSVLECTCLVQGQNAILNSVEGLLLNVELDAIFVK